MGDPSGRVKAPGESIGSGGVVGDARIFVGFWRIATTMRARPGTTGARPLPPFLASRLPRKAIWPVGDRPMRASMISAERMAPGCCTSSGPWYPERETDATCMSQCLQILSGSR